MEAAGLAPTDIDYVNAHGTSTPINDPIETMAIKAVFGDHAKKLKVSSTKSMTGHLLGAAGGVEAIVSVQAIRDQFFPPTRNLDTPDPECDLDYVPHKGYGGQDPRRGFQRPGFRGAQLGGAVPGVQGTRNGAALPLFLGGRRQVAKFPHSMRSFEISAGSGTCFVHLLFLMISRSFSISRDDVGGLPPM